MYKILGRWSMALLSPPSHPFHKKSGGEVFENFNFEKGGSLKNLLKKLGSSEIPMRAYFQSYGM